MIDVTTHGPDGHWDYADIARLCAYRDRLRALNAELASDRDEWARKWYAIRAELAELKFPGMKGIIRAKGETS